MMSEDIFLICDSCAKANGGQWPPGQEGTFHRAQCDVCKCIRNVTEPRDYCLNSDLTRREKPSMYDLYLAETVLREAKADAARKRKVKESDQQ